MHIYFLLHSVKKFEKYRDSKISDNLLFAVITVKTLSLSLSVVK